MLVSAEIVSGSMDSIRMLKNMENTDSEADQKFYDTLRNVTRFNPDIALGGSLLETGARTSSSSWEGSALGTRASNLRREGSATEVRRSLAQVDEELYRR